MWALGISHLHSWVYVCCPSWSLRWTLRQIPDMCAMEEADANLNSFIADSFQGGMTRVNQQRLWLTFQPLKTFLRLTELARHNSATTSVKNPQHGACQGRPHCWWNHRCFYSSALIYQQKCSRGQSPVSCHTASNWSWTPTRRPRGGQLAWWRQSDPVLPTHTVFWDE